jgi:hypothetical protein
LFPVFSEETVLSKRLALAEIERTDPVANRVSGAAPARA